MKVFALKGVYEDRILILPGIDDVMEMIFADLLELELGDDANYYVEIRDMSEKELNELPETD